LTKPSTDRPWGVVFLIAGLPATFSAMVLPFNPTLALPWVIVSWPVTAYAGYRIWRASHPKSTSTAIATRIRVVPPSASSSRSSEIAGALQAFLDDPDGRQFVTFEDLDGFYVQLAISGSDASPLLHGEVVSNANLPGDRQVDAGRDAERQRELLTLGWDAPSPAWGDNYSATWSGPIEIDLVVTFVEATARIFGVDPVLLSPDFGSPPPVKGRE
jgi:hypothetical protein